MNRRDLQRMWYVGLALLASCLPVLAQNDRLVLGSASGAAGQAIDMAVNLQDIPGNHVDTIPPFDGFYDVAMKLTFDASLVSAIEFVRAGLTEETQPILFASTPGTGSVQLLSSYLDPIPVTLGGPEERYCTLRVTPTAAAAGRTISFTLVDTDTYILGNSGFITLQQSLGNLTVSLGSLSVASSGGSPVIGSFSASPSTIQAGSSSTLSWSVTGATTVSISPTVGSVAASGSTSVSPSQTTTYTLTATNASGSVSQTTTVTVAALGAPQITSFTASPTQVTANQSTTLTWATTNASSVSISPTVGVVAASGSQSITPGTTTTYTLTATNATGTVTATTTVTVVATPQIVSFTASPSQIALGESSTLSWNVTGALSVTLDGATVAATGSRAVTISATTTYTLVATGALNQTATKRVTVQLVGNTSLRLSTNEFDFGDATEETDVSLSVNGIGVFAYTLQGIPSWLSVTPASGTVDGERNTDLKLTVLRDRMFPGQFASATIVATSSGVRDASIVVSANRPKRDDETYLYYPLIQTGVNIHGELTVVNLHEESAEMLLQIYLPDGTLAEPPIEETLASDGSYRYLLDPVLIPSEAWAVATLTAAGGNAPRAQGCVNVRTDDGEQLYGLSAETQLSDFLYVPHIAQDTAVFFTHGSVVNLGQEDRTAQIETSSPVTIATSVPAGQAFFSFADVLGSQISSVNWSRIELDPGDVDGTIGAEVFGYQDFDRTVGVNLSDRSSSTLYFAHIARDLANFWTGIVVINLENRNTRIDFQAYNYDGQLIGGGFSQTFGPREKKTFVVLGSRLDFGTDAAWVKVTSSGKMTGYELFANPASSAGDTFAGLEAITDLSRRLVFCHTEEGVSNNGVTALALINPGTVPAPLTFRLIRANGFKKAETTLPDLAPKLKLTRTLSQIFPGTRVEYGDIILVDSDQEIAGFELYGDLSQTMGAILAAPND